jgi:hypothetical protein
MRLQTMIDVLNEWARASGVGPDAQVRLKGYSQGKEADPLDCIIGEPREFSPVELATETATGAPVLMIEFDAED